MPPVWPSAASGWATPEGDTWTVTIAPFCGYRPRPDLHQAGQARHRGLAIHDDHADARFHPVLLDMRLALNNPKAEIANGAAIFERRCSQCHGLDGESQKGPFLNGGAGRPTASVESWVCSPAMKGGGGVWTVETLQTTLTKPAAFLPDVAMNFGGFRSKPKDRDKVVANLISAGG